MYIYRVRYCKLLIFPDILVMLTIIPSSIMMVPRMLSIKIRLRTGMMTMSSSIL